jgi:glycerol uptake facilitator-like aquaporin
MNGRAFWAEALGTLLLLTAIIGTAQMATPLTKDAALRLLVNAGASAAALYVAITLFGPLSGGAFNPAVTWAHWRAGRQSTGTALQHVLAQILGAFGGAILAHAMFSAPLGQIATVARPGPGLFLAEVAATAGLVLIVQRFSWVNGEAAPVIAAYIFAAYWCTASSSFANPAVTLARMFTASEAGILPRDGGFFLLAQGIGALTGAWGGQRLFAPVGAQ